MKIERFEDIQGWQEARSLTKIIYKLTNKLPCHLYVALDQEYISGEDFAGAYNQAKKTKSLINGFIAYLKGKK